MLERLEDIRLRLPALLAEGVDAWESLDIDYELPRVERLWRQVEGLRVYLHKIHPCKTALNHPHPWPSAVEILSGDYEMGLSLGDAEVSRMVLASGSRYEMVNPHGWHYVRPFGPPSLSLMVTAPPWDPPVYDHSDFGKKVELKPLEPVAKAALHLRFSRLIAAGIDDLE